jgi:hypothetical protein
MTWQVDVLRFTLLGIGSPFAALLEGAGFTTFTPLYLVLATRMINPSGVSRSYAWGPVVWPGRLDKRMLVRLNASYLQLGIVDDRIHSR